MYWRTSNKFRVPNNFLHLFIYDVPQVACFSYCFITSLPFITNCTSKYSSSCHIKLYSILKIDSFLILCTVRFLFFTFWSYIFVLEVHFILHSLKGNRLSISHFCLIFSCIYYSMDDSFTYISSLLFHMLSHSVLTTILIIVLCFVVIKIAFLQ